MSSDERKTREEEEVGNSNQAPHHYDFLGLSAGGFANPTGAQPPILRYTFDESHGWSTVSATDLGTAPAANAVFSTSSAGRTGNTPGGVFRDYNGDNYVDRADLDLFTPCTTGPAVPYDLSSLPEGCDLSSDIQGVLLADLDRDGDVDQNDFGIFQQCYSGSSIEAATDCR